MVKRSEPSAETIRVSLPDYIDAVVGDTLEIFYRGIISAVDPYRYNINFIAPKGNRYPRKWVYTPVAGDNSFPVVVDVYDDQNFKVGSGSTVIRVNNNNISPDKMITVLCMGDSLSANKPWYEEFYRRITRTGGEPAGDGITNVETIGTLIRNGVRYEGYGGWTWGKFLSAPSDPANSDVWVTILSGLELGTADEESIWRDANEKLWQLETIDILNNRIKFKHYPISDKPNYLIPADERLTWVSGGTNREDIIYKNPVYEGGSPFWSIDTNSINFREYITRNGFNEPDVFYILLGWNEIGTKTFTASHHQTTIDNAKSFIDKLHTDYPDCKVVLLGVQVPSTNGGLGHNYGSNDDRWNYFFCLQSVFGLNDAYKQISNDPAYSSFVDFIQISAVFDSEYNMPYKVVPVNSRSTITERLGINGVHPDTPGYYQIADAVYRHFKHEFIRG
jgi:lysophospholipase L1-like esterase